MPYGLPRIPLRHIAETDRFWYLDRLEQYLRNRQDDGKRYDWDGSLRELGGVKLYAPTPAGFDVPFADRRPNTRYNLPRVIVSSLTQMALGGNSFAELNVEGDDKAERALRTWARLMCLPTRIAEARNFGGAEGTACLSLAISRGRFRCDVHNPKHCTVLAWADRDEFVPARVIKAYSYEQDVLDEQAQRSVKRTFWYVRYWDSQVEVMWSALPDEAGKTPDWQTVAPDFVAEHRFGFTPFYWVQNLPDSQELDGEGDYEGIEDKFDEINQLLSATTKGARKNVDPTLVVRDVDNEEPINKGSGAVIFSPNGADYLELKGTAIEASIGLLKDLRETVLEEAQVVLPREENVSGGPMSAAAMRIRYRPMIARCNTLRDQYGPVIERICTDMLSIARGVRARGEYEVALEDGTTVRRRDELRPNLDPGGEQGVVTLRWPEYFSPTSQDVKDTTSTAQGAAGGKPVISHRTAVDFVSRLYGVQDVDEELAAIEADSAAEADRMGEQLEREAKIYASRPMGGTAQNDSGDPKAAE